MRLEFKKTLKQIYSNGRTINEEYKKQLVAYSQNVIEESGS